MPKLDDSHTISRITKRLEELEQDIEVSAKDFRAVLTQEQHDAYERAWEEQQALRKKRRARTKEEIILLTFEDSGNVFRTYAYVIDSVSDISPTSNARSVNYILSLSSLTNSECL